MAIALKALPSRLPPQREALGEARQSVERAPASLHGTWALEAVALRLGIPDTEVASAGRVLDRLRDPLRRRLLETLARRAQPMSPGLVRQLGATARDVRQRLRTLHQIGVIAIERRRVYRVHPSALAPLRRYFDLLLCAASMSPPRDALMAIDLDLALAALADPMRRGIFEHIVIRPRRVSELAVLLPVTRQNISHHVRVLGEAGLIHHGATTLAVVTDALPQLRTYFDRLWLEASLGDAWLLERTAAHAGRAA